VAPLQLATAEVMESGLALLRLTFERGWSVGLLFTLFCGGALGAAHYGIELPDLVKQWSGAGLLFGAAVLVMSLAVNVVAFVRRKSEERSQRRAEAAEEAAEAKRVLANLEALTVDEAAVLARLLSSGVDRFQVHIVDDAYKLLQMRILKIDQSMGGLAWICKLHPALEPQREELAKHLGAELHRLSYVR
jgi:hypothetical protein